jgi:hypothetical protein
MVTIQNRLPAPLASSQARTAFDRCVRLAVAAYLVLLFWQTVSTFSPDVVLPWFRSSDETAIAGEVIRFSNVDFHQRFYDMPGTPLMLFGAVQWRAFYWWAVLLDGFHGDINSFSFQHLQQLLMLLRVDNVSFFLLSALLLFRIVSRASNQYAGAAAATLLVANPAYSETAAYLRVEPLTMCFMLAAILVLTECRWKSASFWAGLLGGVAVACRLHSITATLPILVLLLSRQTWGQATEYSPPFRRFIAYLAPILFLASAGLFCFFGLTSRPLKTEYPLAFALLAKASLMLCFSIGAVLALYLLPKSRQAVVNTVTPRFFGLAGGVVVGFLLGAPNIFTQYGALLKSLNYYSGQYGDPVAMHLPFGVKIVSYLGFYLKVISPDGTTLVLLIAGVSLILLMPRWRVLWPYLAAAAAFFFSKPLDLLRAAHHVALWMPFYVMISVVPISAVCEALEKRGRPWRYLTAPFVVLVLLALHVEVEKSSVVQAALAAWHAERLHNIERLRPWILANTEKDSSFAIAFYCFGPDAFYSLFRGMGLSVPEGPKDSREYFAWFGGQSELEGKSGFACVSPQDVPYLKNFESRKAGEGIDPLHDDRFRAVQSFGEGESENRITLLRFNMSITENARPTGLTFSMPSALRLDSLSPYDNSAIQGKSPVVVTTSPARFSYAASIPIILDPAIGAKAWAHVRGRVVLGQIGIGILDRTKNTLQNEEVLSPSPSIRDFYINLGSNGQADALLIRNASREGASSMALEETEIVTRAHRIGSVTSLDEVELEYNNASIVRKPDLMITTAPEKWAYAASIPVHASVQARGIVLRVRAHILNGEVGFSLLSADRKSLQFEQSYSSSHEPIDVFLPVLPSDGHSRLLIRDTAPNGTRSCVVLDGIETWQLE